MRLLIILAFFLGLVVYLSKREDRPVPSPLKVTIIDDGGTNLKVESTVIPENVK